MTGRELKVGDHVAWQSVQGRTTRKIKKKLTSPIDIKGHHVAASRDNPEYLVVSDGSGAEAAHRPGAPTKIADSPGAPRGL